MKTNKQNIIIGGVLLVTLGLFLTAYDKGQENMRKRQQERIEQGLREVEEHNRQLKMEQDSIQRVQEYQSNMKDSIKIMKTYCEGPNSAGGVDVNIIWKNNTKRTIKYMRFHTVALNAVGDMVPCTIRGYDRWLKVTGPIKSGRVDGYGTYWDCVFYNHSIRKVKVLEYEIEFMDGETITIPVS